MTGCRMIDRNGFAAAIWMMFLAASSAEADGVSTKRLYLDGQYGQIHVRMAQPASQVDNVHTPVAFFHHTPGSSRLYEAVALLCDQPDLSGPGVVRESGLLVSFLH